MTPSVRQTRVKPRRPGAADSRRPGRLLAVLSLLLLGAPARGQVPPPDPSPDEKPLFSIASPIGPFEYRPGRGLRVGDIGLNVGGFTTVEFDREDSGALEIELDSVNLLVLFEPLPILRGFAELEFGDLYRYDGASGDVDSDPDVTIERLHGDLTLDDPLNFRFGKFQTPVGRWNLVPAEPFVWTANEPVMVERAFDEFQTGAAFYGSVYPGGDTLDYWLYGQVVDPLDPDSDEDPADRSVGGRLRYGNPLRGWSVGASYLGSNRGRDWSHLGGLDALFVGERFEIQTEFVFERGSILERELWSAYVQGAYEIVPTLHLVGRYEYFDPTNSNDDPHVFDMGAAWIPKPWLHLKLTYRAVSHPTEDASRGLFGSVSLVF